MAQNRRIFWLTLLLAAVGSLTGCGGATFDEGDAAGSAAQSQAAGGGPGYRGAGGNGTPHAAGNNTPHAAGNQVPVGTAGRGGQDGTGGSGVQVCCEAAPICDHGDTVMPSSGCPAGATCYRQDVCCSTLWCVRSSTCTAYPTCNSGDLKVQSCSAAGCYARSLCGTTIFCLSELEGGYPHFDGGPVDAMPMPDVRVNSDGPYYDPYPDVRYYDVSPEVESTDAPVDVVLDTPPGDPDD